MAGAQSIEMDLFNIDVSVISSFKDKSNAELQSFIKSREYLDCDEQRDLNIYACFLLSIRTRSVDYLFEAIQPIRERAAMLGPDHAGRNRRLQAIGILASWMGENENVFEDVTLYIHESMLYAAQQDHPYPDEMLDNFIALLSRRSDRTKSKDDRDRVVQLTEMAIDATPHYRSHRRVLLMGELADQLRKRFDETGSSKDIDRAIEVANMAANAAPRNAYRAVILSSLRSHLRSRFELNERLDDIDRAIQIGQIVVDTTLHDNDDRARRLDILGSDLSRRYERVRSIDDLNHAIKIAYMAIGISVQGSLDWGMRLSTLSGYLARRFNEMASLEDLNRAIEISHTAIDAIPPDYPDYLALSNNLANYLLTRFERTGLLDDLNHAIKVANSVLYATPSTDADWASRLNNLSNSLIKRFERTGSTSDLDRAVELAISAVEDAPLDHPGRAVLLNTLGNQLGCRFERTGSKDDLDRAVEVARMAVDIAPEHHVHRTSFLNTLGNQLGSRFEVTGSLNDLNQALELANLAVDATSRSSPYRASHLNNLASRLVRRFERTGSMSDLNRAIEVLDLAVASSSPDLPDQASWLNSLGNALSRRFDRTGSMFDLNRAVEVASSAVATTPINHPDRAGWLNSLGYHLSSRFGRAGVIDDLNQAIEITEMAVETTPQENPDWAGRLNNLGIYLSTRTKVTRSTSDLSRAIKVAIMAVDATPKDHTNWAGRSNNLGNSYGVRFKREGSMNDLAHAVEIVGKAVNSTPEDHPSRAERLRDLADWLGSRSEKVGSKDDLDHRLSLYTDGWDCRNAPPSDRIQSAKKAASILASESKWIESSTLLQEAVKILPTVSPRSLQNTDKQHMLKSFAGLASMAVATALNAGEEPFWALQLLESGRNIISGLLLEMRGDIFDLQQQHPGLASEFVTLRDLLDSPISSKSTSSVNDASIYWESLANQRYEADQRFNDLLEQIRTQPGFQNYLLPPTAGELMAAANPDPIIVINLSSFRCDAFLVQRDRIRVLELPHLRLQEVQERIRSLKRSRLSALTGVLKWLWDSVCGPCLEALGFRDPVLNDDWPHVWWVPTGVLSQLPLHAAGYHARGSTKAVLDRVMSSYTSSIKALMHGRRSHVRTVSRSQIEQALLIAMPETPGLSTNRHLPFVDREVQMFRDLCPSLRLKAVTPIPRKDDVLQHLASSKIFHFAGHGRSDPVEPSRSCLLLEDWQTNPLTVEDLRDHRLQKSPPFLGYLSACSTGSNEADELLDEGIHLISALQLAGFRHVVGTLWEVSDKHCVDVARVLYETISKEGLTDLAVCRGLHQAIRGLRNAQIETREPYRTFTLALPGPQPEDVTNHYWAPYVHFGV